MALGVVETASTRAVTVTYRPSDARGTAVDTVTARYVTARTEIDPTIDRDHERAEVNLP